MDDSSVHTENESGGVVNRLSTVIYQADLCIAKRYVNKKAHV